MRLIDADKLIERINQLPKTGMYRFVSVRAVFDAILKETTIEPEPSAQPDLIAKIQNGINATNANDSYSCGMRNGMRWCISLVDGKEPLFENCPSVQPEEIGYEQCANAMMKMWIDEVVTDGEYNRIMDKLNKHWRGKQDGKST